MLQARRGERSDMGENVNAVAATATTDRAAAAAADHSAVTVEGN